MDEVTRQVVMNEQEPQRNELNMQSRTLVSQTVARPSSQEENVAPAEVGKNKTASLAKMSVESLNFYYGKVRALKEISLTIPNNQVTAFIGPSGCGKSTLLRTLNRMNDIIPNVRVEGLVELDGQDIYAPKTDVVSLRRRIGMVFQKSNPFPRSIFDNVAYGLKINNLTRSKAELESRVESSLRAAALWEEVKDRLKQSASGLSGGQQQRLCIARALAVEPEVILMDEPCSALDPIATQKIEELIVELKEQYTIVIVTHNMQQAARVSDLTVFFWLGELVEFNETEKIFTKPEAATVLRQELSKRGYRCSPVTLGANTDAWQPAERELRITRHILEVLVEFRHPVSIITKSALVERDLELLQDLARDNLVHVLVSVTTLDDELKRRMEPRTAGPRRRLETIRRLSTAGIPCGVLAAPMIPGLNDHELENILAAAADAGARFAGYVLLRLPHEVEPIFAEWLQVQYPLKAAKVLSLIRQVRGGALNDAQFGSRMRGSGPLAALLAQRFAAACRRHGFTRESEAALDSTRFRVPAGPGTQLDLLD